MNTDDKSSVSAQIDQLMSLFNQRFDALEDRLGSIENQFVKFAGDVAALKSTSTGNKKKSPRWANGSSAYSRPSKISGTASTD